MPDQIITSNSTKDVVIPNLHMGGGWLPLSVIEQFDALVLCAIDAVPPDDETAGIDVFRCWLWDAKPTNPEIYRARQAALFVKEQVVAGRKTVVTCQCGLNRSGLVVGLALRSLGYDAEEAIRLVRAARGPFALSNEHFVEVIRNA